MIFISNKRRNSKNKFTKIYIVLLLGLSAVIIFKISIKISYSKENKSVLTNTKNCRFYKYEPEVVNLEGVIKISTNFGPPNYGETPEIDKKVTIYILELNSPINVLGDPNDELNLSSFTNISNIQIALYKYKNDIKNKINKKVIIKGTLFQGVTGHHYTDILITVHEIKLKKDIKN